MQNIYYEKEAPMSTQITVKSTIYNNQ